MKFATTTILSLLWWTSSVYGEGHGDGHDHDHDDHYHVPSASNVTRVPYADGDLVGFLALPEGASAEAPVPAVIYIPDWNNVNEYEKLRATMTAESLGWAGFAADIYGAEYEVDGVPDDMRGQLAGRFRNQEPQLFLERIQAAVTTVAAMPEVDSTKIALAGYCLGGSGVLMYAVNDEIGNDAVAAVVSFHGGLGAHIFNHSTMMDTTNNKPPILVLSGGDDDASSNIQQLEKTLDNATNVWEITRYWGIRHAWTVFGGGAYNEWADKASWFSMVEFLEEIFGETSWAYEPAGVEGVEAVEYADETDGTALKGYLAKPAEDKWQSPSPAVIIIPNWDGTNLYEQERAKLLSELGYVAFAADIYGADLQTNLTRETRIEQSTLYRATNQSLFFSRMQTAIDLIASYDYVDADNIAMIGYCFGGSGVFQYALMGGTSVKVVAAFHGNFQQPFLPPATAESITPFTMILSGGDDGSHGNQTLIEGLLNGADADWEISRWSGVGHGFTEWQSPAYNLRADYRSWTAFLEAMESFMKAPVEVFDAGVPTEDDSSSSSSSSSSSMVIATGAMVLARAAVG